MEIDKLSTMHTMHIARTSLTKTERILEIQAARDAAIVALKVPCQTWGNQGLRSEGVRALRSLQGVFSMAWRETFEQVIRYHLEHHRRDLYNALSGDIFPRDQNRKAVDALDLAEQRLKGAIGHFDALVNEVFAEHGLGG